MNALERSAQAWCTDKTSEKEMDVELCKAFADILDGSLRTLSKMVVVMNTYEPIDMYLENIEDLIKYAIKNPTGEETK